MTATAEQNKELAKKLMDLAFIKKDVNAAAELITDRYIQHNPNVPTGKAGFVQGIPMFYQMFPDLKWELKNIWSDGDYVIEQKGKQFPVNDEFTKITLAKMPFTLYFKSLPYDTNGKKFYATQIAVTRETGDIKKIAVGININDIPYFAAGTGNATLGAY